MTHHLVAVIKAALISLVSAYGLLAVIGVVAVASMLFLRKHQADIKYAEAALKLIKELLGSKLGSKGDAVFDLWIDGLHAVKNGDFKNADAVDEFVKFIKLNAKTKAIDLSADEVTAVQSVAIQSVDLVRLNASTTSKAVSNIKSQS
jgi:hypothetical protein